MPSLEILGDPTKMEEVAAEGQGAICTVTPTGARGTVPIGEPGWARVPTVKPNTGSRSNLSCCSLHTPNIYEENRVKGATPVTNQMI